MISRLNIERYLRDSRYSNKISGDGYPLDNPFFVHSFFCNIRVYISRHRNMLVVESFLKSLIEIYGKHTVYSDGGTWYPEACISLGLVQLLVLVHS